MQTKYEKQNLKMLFDITKALGKITKETDGRNAYIYTQARDAQLDIAKLIHFYKHLQAERLYEKVRDKIEVLKNKLKEVVNDEDSGVCDIYNITYEYNIYMKRLNKLVEFSEYHMDRYYE